jgi:hypothetical protein
MLVSLVKKKEKFTANIKLTSLTFFPFLLQLLVMEWRKSVEKTSNSIKSFRTRQRDPFISHCIVYCCACILFQIEWNNAERRFSLCKKKSSFSCEFLSFLLFFLLSFCLLSFHLKVYKEYKTEEILHLIKFCQTITIKIKIYFRFSFHSHHSKLKKLSTEIMRKIRHWQSRDIKQNEEFGHKRNFRIQNFSLENLFTVKFMTI